MLYYKYGDGRSSTIAKNDGFSVKEVKIWQRTRIIIVQNAATIAIIGTVENARIAAVTSIMHSKKMKTNRP